MIPTLDPKHPSPSRYRPNQNDDRRLDGIHRQAYFGVASALDALEEDIFWREVYPNLDAQTRRNIRSAENALRRAAFGIVVHAPDPEPDAAS